MSTIRADHFYTDVELLLKDFLATNITDPISGSRGSKTPFVIAGEQLQRKKQYPHVIVQYITSFGKRFAMGSKAITHNPLLVQVSIYAKNKKQVSTIRDDILYKMLSNNSTINGYGLYNMEKTGDGVMAYNNELKIHARSIDFSFIHHQMVT